MTEAVNITTGPQEGFVVYVREWGPSVVHRTSCRYYRRRRGDELSSGTWEGPYDTEEDARNGAVVSWLMGSPRRRRRWQTARCGVCR